MKQSFAWVALITVVMCVSARADSPDFRLFGSIGNEVHLTPANPSSRLNPGDFLRIPPAANSLDFNLFADLVPEDKSWKFHFKLRGSNDWNRDRGVTKGEIGELNYSISLAGWLDLQVGRSIEKWGTGYAWNPTGVVNPRKNPSDPNDRRGLYQGVDNVKVDLFIRDWNLTVLAVPEIDWEGEDGKHLMATGWAARAYRLIGGIDLSLSASGGSGLPNSQGISVARVVGNALELHAEVAAFQDSVRFRPVEWHDSFYTHFGTTAWVPPPSPECRKRSVFLRSAPARASFTCPIGRSGGKMHGPVRSAKNAALTALPAGARHPGSAPSAVFPGATWSPSSRNHVELLLGGQYTFPHNVNLVLEYFHSGDGLDGREWKTYQDMVLSAGQDFRNGNPLPLLTSNLHFSVLTMARDYAFGRLYWLFHHDKLEAEALVLMNLRDGSSLVRPGLYWKIHPNWSIYWLQGELFGGATTEFGHLQVSRVSDFGVRYHF